MSIGEATKPTPFDMMMSHCIAVEVSSNGDSARCCTSNTIKCSGHEKIKYLELVRNHTAAQTHAD